MIELDNGVKESKEEKTEVKDSKDELKHEHHPSEHNGTEHKHGETHAHKEHSSPETIKSNKINEDKITLMLVALLGVILIINIFITAGLNKAIEGNIEKSKEQSMPARIELTVIKDSTCSECFDAGAVVKYVKSSKLNITKERTSDFSSNEAKALISKYGIKKLPSVILTGEIDKVNIEGFEKKEDALIFSLAPPPYIDVATKEVKGIVKVYSIVDSSCKECFDTDLFVSQLTGEGISIKSNQKLDINSAEAKDMISKYKLDFVPSIILSKDAVEYELINSVWTRLGTKENDGNYVMRMKNPPYINLTTNELKGMVDVIYLTDKTCKECYDVSIHRKQLGAEGLNLGIKSEKTIDITDEDGKKLVAKYNITLVPTIILSKDITEYPASQSLAQLFYIKEDGSYIFKELGIVGDYMDISKGEVIKADTQ